MPEAPWQRPWPFSSPWALRHDRESNEHTRPWRRRSRRESSINGSIQAISSTFASNALAGGVTVLELARLMGTSVRMIERHYGTLLEGPHAGLVTRLDALEAALLREAEAK